jgi:hypothetical protein
VPDSVGVADVVRLVIAVILLLAGGSKLFSPQALARGLAEMSGRVSTATGGFAVAARAVAVVELTAAVLLAGQWSTPIGGLLAGAVGFGIAAFAGTGLVLRRRPSCGCFGADSGRPVGPVNLAAGLAITAGAALIGRAGPGWGEPAEGLILTALCTLAVVLVGHRAALARPFRRHFRTFASAPVARELS